MPKTPEMPPYEPVTPGRDPAAIDRRMLVGVGELATPRWARGARNDDFEFVAQERVDEANEEEPVDLERPEDERDSDSPWTIEAVDGEPEEVEEEEKTEVSPRCAFACSSFLTDLPATYGGETRRSPLA